MRAGTRGAHPTPRCCGPSHSCTLSPPAPAPPFSQGHGCRPLRPISRGLVEMPPSPSGGCGAWGPHHTSLCSPKASRTVMCFIQSENKHYFFRAPVSPPFQSHPPTGRGGEWGGMWGSAPLHGSSTPAPPRPRSALRRRTKAPLCTTCSSATWPRKSQSRGGLVGRGD